MKKMFLLIILLTTVHNGKAQFSRMPLDYPHNAIAHIPSRMSIVDENTIWVGTWRTNSWTSWLPYSKAVKTTDGGHTWEFYPIPATGMQYISDVEAWDANTCFYLFQTSLDGGGQIWKTNDGGTNWTLKSTTQFTGGYPDFIHFFSQDTLMALGDPTSGYFEIHLSNDGGDTWTRVPQSNIPPLIHPTEAGFGGKSFGAIGNTIWFGTSKGRCFKSDDRGTHWTVSVINSDTTTFGWWYVCFSDLLHGISYRSNTQPPLYYLTNDGGTTWTSLQTKPDFLYPFICRVDGIYGGYILAAQEPTGWMPTSVYFTNNFFSTLTKIDSNLYSYYNYVYFKDANNGWITGGYGNDSTILKYTGVLTSVQNKQSVTENLTIIPNPSNQNALITFPAGFLGQKKTMKIIDLAGKLIREYALKADEQSMTLDSGLFSDGVYIIQVISESGSVSNNHWIISH